MKKNKPKQTIYKKKPIKLKNKMNKKNQMIVATRGREKKKMKMIKQLKFNHNKPKVRLHQHKRNQKLMRVLKSKLRLKPTNLKIIQIPNNNKKE